jgi:alanine dehydrogenase
MPGAVGRTSTYALCNVTLPWVLRIAERGVIPAAEKFKPIARAVNTYSGKITCRAVAETFDLPFDPRFDY